MKNEKIEQMMYRMLNRVKLFFIFFFILLQKRNMCADHMYEFAKSTAI